MPRLRPLRQPLTGPRGERVALHVEHRYLLRCLGSRRPRPTLTVMDEIHDTACS